MKEEEPPQGGMEEEPPQRGMEEEPPLGGNSGRWKKLCAMANAQYPCY